MFFFKRQRNVLKGAVELLINKEKPDNVIVLSDLYLHFFLFNDVSFRSQHIFNSE
jgi:hypothetical protein